MVNFTYEKDVNSCKMKDTHILVNVLEFVTRGGNSFTHTYTHTQTERERERERERGPASDCIKAHGYY